MSAFVLNFPVTNRWDKMTRIFRMFFLVIFLTAVADRPASAQAGLAPIIKKPQAGEVLQGTLTITGTSNLTGFLASEVAFAYSGDTTGTWFLIATSSQPVENGALATWDTTTITDGVYTLRLRVYLADGTFREVIAPQMRVRNYTPVETPTPTMTPPALTLVPTFTLTATLIPTSTPFPTPTELPPNPAILTSADVSISIGYGGVAAVILLSIIGIYLWLRRK